MKEGGAFIVEIMNGAEDGRIVKISTFPVTIGRASENLVQLPYDHLLSRHHARIEKTDRLILRDLKSTNGTYVGKQRVRGEVPVELDQLFRVGATLLTVRHQTAGDGMSSPEPGGR